MTDAHLDIDFFPHSCLYLCCFPQNADLCDPDLRPRSPRTKVGFCCGPGGRSLCPSSPGQAPSLLSAARGHLHGILCPQQGLSCPPAWRGHAWNWTDRIVQSRWRGFRSSALAPQSPGPQAPAQTPKQPGLDAGAPFPHAQETPRPPAGPEAQETPHPRPPAGPKAQDMKQEMWLWPWSG